ncbi:MAG TPA: hypothetical protein VNI57_03850, partial [Candidatus Saccharimonadales bacterium]|nr:hypothetical protein [Candidatus Saccharimonadales bacterium]
MTSEMQPDGSLRVRYEFNDRGRGPKLDSRIEVCSDGHPAGIETTGTNYLKGEVHESFSVRDGAARWTNAAGQGEKKSAGKAFYLSMDGTPIETGLLAAALLADPDRSVALLPSGEASLSTAGEASVPGPDGKDRKVVLHEITGLGFEPVPVWLDPDGGFFASADEWLTVIRKGWEGEVPALLERQHAARDARQAEDAAR